MTTTTTITPTTKVNLGILVLMLGAVGGGATFISKLDTNVETLISVNEKMVRAIDRNTAQLAANATALAVHENRLDAIEAKK
tara:strand:- start:11507 stop:11752 length:246 start_codon:yes stop_codon:yes gene_type:complete